MSPKNKTHVAETGQDTRFVKPGEATFGLKHRVFRLLWSVTWTVACSWTPPFLRKWRIAVLRCFGADVDWNAMVYSSVSIWYPPNLSMARLSTLGPKVNCYCMDKIHIGESAIVSQAAFLCGGTHDVDDEGFPLVIGPIHIGPRAWVASEAFVAPGVTLAEGAVLGARSVAAKDLEPYGIYVGNPAQYVRQRKFAESETAS